MGYSLWVVLFFYTVYGYSGQDLIKKNKAL